MVFSFSFGCITSRGSLIKLNLIMVNMDYVIISQAAKRLENEIEKNKIALKMAKEMVEALKKRKKYHKY